MHWEIKRWSGCNLKSWLNFRGKSEKQLMKFSVWTWKESSSSTSWCILARFWRKDNLTSKSSGAISLLPYFNHTRQFFTIFPKLDFFTGWWMRTIIVLTFSPSGENVNTNMALIHRQVKGETYHSTLRMIWDQMILWQMILKSILPLRSIITNNDRRELCFPSPCGER